MKLSQFCSAIMGILYAVILLGCGNDDVIVDSDDVIIDSAVPAPTKIAFSLDLDPSDSESNLDIYVINPDGTNLVNITKSETHHEYRPDWSPDGEKIVFVSWHKGSTDHINVMNADGTNLVNIYKDVNDCWSWAPTWSPDGDKIAFELGSCTTNVEGIVRNKNDIYVMNADGTNLVNITKGELYFFGQDPAWSPDGEKIAFASRFGNFTDRGIYVMNADGTNAIKITKGEELYSHPAWSPDGNKIAFAAQLNDNQEIYIMSTNGADVVNLSNHPAEDAQPAWSPDGKKIVFTSNRISDFNLYVMNADGTNQIAIYDRGSAFGPSWTSGQKRLEFGAQGALDILAKEKIQ